MKQKQKYRFTHLPLLILVVAFIVFYVVVIVRVKNPSTGGLTSKASESHDEQLDFTKGNLSKVAIIFDHPQQDETFEQWQKNIVKWSFDQSLPPFSTMIIRILSPDYGIYGYPVNEQLDCAQKEGSEIPASDTPMIWQAIRVCGHFQQKVMLPGDYRVGIALFDKNGQQIGINASQVFHIVKTRYGRLISNILPSGDIYSFTDSINVSWSIANASPTGQLILKLLDDKGNVVGTLNRFGDLGSCDYDGPNANPVWFYKWESRAVCSHGKLFTINPGKYRIVAELYDANDPSGKVISKAQSEKLFEITK